MSKIHSHITLESLPETMAEKDVRELISLLMTCTANSEEFHELNRHQKGTVIDFCMSVQEILLSAYREPNA